MTTTLPTQPDPVRQPESQIDTEETPVYTGHMSSVETLRMLLSILGVMLVIILMLEVLL